MTPDDKPTTTPTPPDYATSTCAPRFNLVEALANTTYFGVDIPPEDNYDEYD